MVRAGKFKTKRGGGRNFSRDLEGVEGEDAFDKWARKGKGAASSSDEDDSDSESGSGSGSGSGSEESSSEDDEPVAPAPRAVGVTADPKKAALFGNTEPVAEASRADRKAAKKGKKVQQKKGSDESESDEDLRDLKGMGNLNVDKKGKPIAAGSDAQGLNRKEREAEEKKAAAERYRALHAAGKTDQAKNDMARLQKIRKDREEAAAKRLAEAAIAQAAADAKKAQQKARG